MGKQKTYSLPLPWAEWLKKLYDENKSELEQLNIESDVDLLKVLARLGKPRLERLIAEVAETEKMTSQLRETQEPTDTARRKTLQNPPT